jgi:hypothetical protein
MNLQRILDDIARAPEADPPPDPEACLECLYHTSSMKFDGDGTQHCYMFKTMPETLCMIFRKIPIRRM